MTTYYGIKKVHRCATCKVEKARAEFPDSPTSRLGIESSCVQCQGSKLEARAKASAHKERMCGRKVRHTTKDKANAAALKASEKYGVTTKSYRCPECLGFHLSTRTDAVAGEQCEKKKRFRSKAKAQAEANEINKAKGTNLVVFLCPECNGHHLHTRYSKSWAR